MVSPSFESSHPNSPCVYPLWHFFIHPSPSSCCETHFPSWRNHFLRSCLACWLGSVILLHFGFQLFIGVLRFGIPLSFAALHSSESVLPHQLRGPGFVAVAKRLAVVQLLAPSRTLRNSFVTGRDGLNDQRSPKMAPN